MTRDDSGAGRADEAVSGRAGTSAAAAPDAPTAGALARASVWRSPIAPPCVLGFALAISFQALQDITSARISSLAGLAADGSFITAMRLVQFAALVALALVATRITSLGDRRGVVVGAGALCLALCGVLSALLLDGGISTTALHAALSVLKAIAPVLLWLLWAELFAHMDERHVLPYYLTVTAVSGCLTLALSPLPAVVIPPVCAVMGIASLVLLVIARRRLDAAPFARGESPAASWSFPTTVVILQVVFSFANVFARNTLPAEDRVFVTFGVIACLGVLLATALMPRGRHLRASTLCDVAFPLTLAGLLGLTLNGAVWSFVAPAAAYGGEALFGAFVVVTLCAIAFRCGVNPLVLFGFAQAAATVGGLGASIAVGAMRRAGTATVTGAVAPTAVCAALALAVCYVMLARERGKETTWGVAREQPARRLSIATRVIGRVSGVSAPEQESRAPQPAQATVPSTGVAAAPTTPCDLVVVSGSAVTRDDLLATCAQIAYEFGMTRREEQVLALLCQGMSAAQIEERLCVSNSTVKTHTHAVYQKLGIHGRQDVTAYVATRLRERAGARRA